MNLYMEENIYESIIDHCVRKLNKNYYEDETKEQQAFGVILGEKNIDGYRITKIINLKNNYRYEKETSKKMNDMLEKYAIPGGIELSERAWAIDPIELNSILMDMSNNEILLGTYHMHSDLSWKGEYPKELPTDLDRELNRGSDLINLIVYIGKKQQKIRAFYESIIDSEYNIIKNNGGKYGN